MSFTKGAVATALKVDAALSGAAGIVAYPAAAAPANGVSLAEVIRAIYDAVGSGLLTAGTVQSLPRMAAKASATLPQTADQTLFTVTGGNVEILTLIGEVTVVIETQANASLIKFNPTGTGADTDLCAALDITADAVGSMYSLTGTFADAMLDGLWTSPTAQNLVIPVILAPGVIEFECAASNTGEIQWFCVWRPIESGASLA